MPTHNSNSLNKRLVDLLAKTFLGFHDMVEVLTDSEKSNTFGVLEAVAMLRQNKPLNGLDFTLDIHGANSAHRQERPRNLDVEKTVAGKSFKEFDAAGHIFRCLRVSNHLINSDGTVVDLKLMITSESSESDLLPSAAAAAAAAGTGRLKGFGASAEAANGLARSVGGAAATTETVASSLHDSTQVAHIIAPEESIRRRPS